MSMALSESAPARARRRSPKGERTRAAILDAAEDHFAQAPYDTVFQRDIAAQAGVLIGVLTHHYPTKVSLFDAVVGRRAAELNEERLRRLHELPAHEVEAILDAFFEPFIDRASGKDAGWRAYFRMMQKFAFVGEGVAIHSKYFMDVIRAFTDALLAASPNLDPTQLQLSFSCAIDLVLTGVFQPGRFEAVFGKADFARLSEGEAVRKRYRHIRPFISGGFRAIVG